MDPENVSFRSDETYATPDVELLAKLEARIDGQEQLLANLMMGYVELWAAIESLTSAFLGSRTEEEQKEFTANFREFRTELLKNIQQVGEDGLDNLDPSLIQTMERMVKGQ